MPHALASNPTPLSLPLIAVWPYAPVFWVIFVATFLPEWSLALRQRKLARTAPQDAGSRRIIMIGNTVGAWCAFAVAFLWRAGAIAHEQVAFWTGVALLVGGAALRRHCFRMLGGSFTGSVLVRPGQEIVRRGAYRRIRHPSYTAAFLIMGGIGLALGNWLSLAVMLAMSVIVYGNRVRVEERALVETLGEPYRAYMRQTKRFLPFIL